MLEATLAKIMAVATRVGTMVDSVADSLSAEVSPTAVVASMVEADRMVADVTERQFC
jgi:phosphatidylserine synthase